MKEFYYESPCKINLSLEVHKKRDDGFHDLTSIFQLISLADKFRGKLTNSKSIIIKGDFNCKQEDNLIYKAITQFYEKFNIATGIEINVEKIIPAGGGIGGGSANCAATLKALDRLFPNLATKEDLYNLGLSLGSDVPFFLKNPTSLVEGRGEHITPLTTITKYYILLVNPGIHISTGEAFKELYKKNSFFNKSVKRKAKMLENYRLGINNFSFFKNSFEIALQSDYTFIRDIKKTMYNSGAIYSALTGSGSTMFGLFNNYETALRAKDVLTPNSQYNIFLVKPMDQFPAISVN